MRVTYVHVSLMSHQGEMSILGVVKSHPAEECGQLLEHGLPLCGGGAHQDGPTAQVPSSKCAEVAGDAGDRIPAIHNDSYAVNQSISIYLSSCSGL